MNDVNDSQMTQTDQINLEDVKLNQVMLELPRTRQKSELAWGSAIQPKGELNQGGMDTDRKSTIRQRSLFVLDESKDQITHREVEVLEVKGSQPYRNQDNYLAFESGNL